MIQSASTYVCSSIAAVPLVSAPLSTPKQSLEGAEGTRSYCAHEPRHEVRLPNGGILRWNLRPVCHPFYSGMVPYWSEYRTYPLPYSTGKWRRRSRTWFDSQNTHNFLHAIGIMESHSFQEREMVISYTLRLANGHLLCLAQ